LAINHLTKSEQGHQVRALFISIYFPSRHIGK
jgi:hypothetical protein